jgi:hypothetical protein
MAEAQSPSAKLAASAKKATEKTVTKVAEAVEESGTDVFASVGVFSENLKPDAAISLVEDLLKDVDSTYFKVGAALSVIQSNGWFKDAGYDNFREFVETRYGLQYRKAMYLVNIYNSLIEGEVPWEKVAHLGWTKLKELAGIINKGNVDEWVKLAEEFTVAQLIEYIKQLKKKNVDPNTSDDEQKEAAGKLSTLSFKVHPDQKEVITGAVEKAMADAGTEYKAVALEAICLSYMNDEPVIQKTDLKSVMAAHSMEQVLELFEELYPDVDLVVKV